MKRALFFLVSVMISTSLARVITIRDLTSSEMQKLLPVYGQLIAQNSNKKSQQVASGFLNPSKESVVSCQLSYEHDGSATERIVSCWDDRSAGPSKNDDQGFTDIRHFEIKVDAQTLAPLEVLKIESIQAG